MRGLKSFDQRLGKLAFWLVMIGILGMGLAFALGGTVQIYVSRTLGLEWFGGDILPRLHLFGALVGVFGFLLTVGAGVLTFDLLTLGQRPGVPETTVSPAGSAWARPLSGFEAGVWLTSMWLFGFLITLGLLSFNLAQVRVKGNPTIPYLMAGIGYPGLLLTTLLFVWRFLASLEARTAEKPLPAAPSKTSLAVPA
jgi:nitric oxide reductase subunit B